MHLQSRAALKFCSIVLMALLFLLFLILSMKTPQIKAQSNRLKLIDVDEGGYFEWSLDSHLVAFSPDILVESEWKTYNVTTNQLIVGNRYPFLPNLTETERAFFVRANDDMDSFAYSSPNERYIVYAGEPTQLNFPQDWRLIIGDRQTQTKRNTSLPIFYPTLKENYFDIFWKADSTSFIIETCSSEFYCTPNTYLYIHGYTSSLDDTLIELPINAFRIEETEYFMNRVLDFSSNGIWVLLRASKEQNSPENNFLVMYNLLDKSQSFEITSPAFNYVGDVKFRTSDGKHILALNEQGVVSYSVENVEVTLVSNEVLIGNVKNSRFSPDGQWLVFETSRSVYLLDLSPSTISPSPTPTALPHPIFPPPGGDPACPGGGGIWVWENGFPIFICQPNWE